MPKFSSINGTSNQNGMYFSSDEKVIHENLKVDTLQSAEKDCEKILTPKICDNQTLAYAVRDLVLRAFLTETINGSSLVRSHHSQTYGSAKQLFVF